MSSMGVAQRLLRSLLAYPTVSGPEGHEQQSLLLDYLLQELRSLPDCVILAHHGRAEGYPFAHVSIGNSPVPGRRILFVCHLDVVPADSPEQWSHDPWGADAGVEYRQFGRGASDMKGPIVALIMALRSVAEKGMGADVIFTSDEESGSAGASSCIEYLHGIRRPAGIVVCEPTDGTIRLGHRGAYWIEVTAAGKAAHASTPDLGISAIFILMDIVEQCRNGQGPSLKQDPVLGRETWNLGIVRTGGDSPNLVPDHAIGVIDYRITNNDVGRIRQWWENKDGITQVAQRLLLPPVRTSRSSGWLSTLAGTIDERPCFCYTDASVITQVFPKLPIVIWGPGESASMHTVDESIDIREIIRIADRYAESIINSGR